MRVTHEDTGPISVVNDTDQPIRIAGYVIPPRGKHDIPRAFVPTIRAHPSLHIEGEQPAAVAAPPERKALGAFVRPELGVEVEQGVSVLIPHLDRAGMLQRACASALASSFTELEVIVVDDGSEPGVLASLADIASAYRKAGIPFTSVYSTTNYGIGSARAMAGRVARYDLFVLLDSDDELASDALMTFSETYRTTMADVIYGHCWGVDDDTGKREWMDPAEWTPGKLKKFGCFIQGPRAISRVAWRLVSGCAEDFRRAEDLDLLIRIEEAGGLFVKADKAVGTIHKHAGSVQRADKQNLGRDALRARGVVNP